MIEITEEHGWGFHEILRMLALECDDGPATDEQRQELANAIFRLHIIVIGGEQRVLDFKYVLADIATEVGRIYKDVFPQEKEGDS